MISEEEQAVIEKSLYEQVIVLTNDMKSQASLPVFKYILASKNMIEYLIEKNQGLIET